MLVYIQMLIALSLGTFSTISDFKSQKIYNKYIVIGALMSFLTYIAFFRQIDKAYIGNFIINFIISCVVSFAFFYLKIWGAGDAKLFIAVIFMIPYELYEVRSNNYFPSMYLLICVFSVAFIYVLIETIVLFIADSEKFSNIKNKRFTKKEIINSIIDFINGCLFSMVFNRIIYLLFPNFSMQNYELIYVINIVLLVFFYRIIKINDRRKVALVVLLISGTLILIIEGINVNSIDLHILLIVSLIMIFRSISEKYNYKTIKVNDLKERMILSFDSVLPFYNSRVNGLPKYTDESTDFRLSKDEVESIKRWSKTSKGNDKITIVRHMPFAPFILIGEIVFFLLKIVF